MLALIDAAVGIVDWGTRDTPLFSTFISLVHIADFAEQQNSRTSSTKLTYGCMGRQTEKETDFWLLIALAVTPSNKKTHLNHLEISRFQF